MRDLLIDIFANHSALIVFLHIIGAVIWVGGMIAIRVAVHPALQAIDENRTKLGTTLRIVGRLFNLVLPFVIIILITAILMAVGLGFKHSPLYWIVHLKETIWTIMAINYTYMYLKRAKAQRLFNSGDLPGAKAQVAKFANLLLPINIVLGIVAIYSGVVLRGF
jgi:uncharacterized membrane protein